MGVSSVLPMIVISLVGVDDIVDPRVVCDWAGETYLEEGSSLSPIFSSVFVEERWVSPNFIKSEKSAPAIENLIGGKAGAMKVLWEVDSTGEDSRESSDPDGSSFSTVTALDVSATTLSLCEASKCNRGGRKPFCAPLASFGGGVGPNSWLNFCPGRPSPSPLSLSLSLSIPTGTSTRWLGELGGEVELDIAQFACCSEPGDRRPLRLYAGLCGGCGRSSKDLLVRIDWAEFPFDWASGDNRPAMDRVISPDLAEEGSCPLAYGTRSAVTLGRRGGRSTSFLRLDSVWVLEEAARVRCCKPGSNLWFDGPGDEDEESWSAAGEVVIDSSEK